MAYETLAWEWHRPATVAERPSIERRVQGMLWLDDDCVKIQPYDHELTGTMSVAEAQSFAKAVLARWPERVTVIPGARAQDERPELELETRPATPLAKCKRCPLPEAECAAQRDLPEPLI